MPVGPDGMAAHTSRGGETMRVAILGAGLAGLACAHELERLGVIPDIYEKRHRVGERFPNVEVMPQFLHHNPGQDILRHFRRHLRLPVQPSGLLERITVQAPDHTVSVHGHLGYLTIRGHDERSLERQLERHIRAKIHFNQAPQPEELAQEYDRVVIACGTQEPTRALGLWQRDAAWWGRGAVVRGDFAPYEVKLWLNTDYAQTGYGFLAPFDERHATIGVGVPDSNPAEVDRLWQRFRAAVGSEWNLELDFKFEQFEVGRSAQVTHGPYVLVGNAGGFVDPLYLGGQCPAATSGVMAARELVRADDSLQCYWRHYGRYYRRLLALRRRTNRFTNADWGRIVALMGLPGARTLFFRAPVNWLRPAGALVSLLGPLAPAPDRHAEPGPPMLD